MAKYVNGADDAVSLGPVAISVIFNCNNSMLWGECNVRSVDGIDHRNGSQAEWIHKYYFTPISMHLHNSYNRRPIHRTTFISIVKQ